jgi:hypothetical protein
MRAADVAVAANGGDLLMLKHGDDSKRGSETTGHAGDDRSPRSSPSRRRGGLGGLRMRAAAMRPSRRTAHTTECPAFAPREWDFQLWKTLR